MAAIRLLLASLMISGALGCATMNLRSAVDFSVEVAPGTPKSALVYVDGRYIGTLAAVEARGVRLVEGEHRISVEKVGYFPFDAIVVSDFKPIELTVKMIKLPE